MYVSQQERMIQHSMNAIGWNDKAKMDELMDQVLTQQPAAN